jgi:hypothetical protein
MWDTREASEFPKYPYRMFMETLSLKKQNKTLVRLLLKAETTESECPTNLTKYFSSGRN